MEMIQGNSLPLTHVRFCLLSPSQQHWFAAEVYSVLSKKRNGFLIQDKYKINGVGRNLLSSSFFCYSKIHLYVCQKDLTKTSFQEVLTHATSSQFRANIQILGLV